MPVQIIRHDITKLKVDAIVNAANSSLLGGGGVDGAIHKAAGDELLKKCMSLGGCRTGDAKITPGYNLPAKYVIHTVGPIWNGGENGEKELLRSCYEKSLRLAASYGCRTVAFPLISAGVYGYPKSQALKVAVDTVRDFLNSYSSDMTVYIVLFDKDATDAGMSLYSGVKQYIDDVYAEAHFDSSRSLQMNMPPANMAPAPMYPMESYSASQSVASEQPKEKSEKKKFGFSFRKKKHSSKSAAEEMDFSSAEFVLDESFSQMLLRKIDEKGMTDPECYKKANIDRKLFSKIRNIPDYKPKKATVISFAIALELNKEETDEMLLKAGYALSHSNKFDVIIEYFIINGIYDFFVINETLFEFDQPLLGC